MYSNDVTAATDRLALLRTAASLGERIAAEAAQRDRQRQFAYAAFEEIAHSGVLAARIPADFGGAGLSVLDTAQLFFAISEGDPNIAMAISPHFCFIESLVVARDEAAQRKFYPEILAGALFANAIAERSGPIVGGITTRLTAGVQDGHTLTGTKYYATGSLFAQWLFVTALDDQGSVRTAIIPADREGVQIVDDWRGAGQRTTASGTVRLQSVHVCADELIDHRATQAGERTYLGAYTQLLQVAIDVGIAVAALKDGVRYAQEHARVVPEAKVASAREDPLVLTLIGELSALSYAATAATEKAAIAVDAAAAAYQAGTQDEQVYVDASLAVARAKGIAAHAALRLSERLFDVGGGSSTTTELNLDRHWRNARTHTLHDPVAHKYKAIGDYLLNGVKPPKTPKF